MLYWYYRAMPGEGAARVSRIRVLLSKALAVLLLGALLVTQPALAGDPPGDYMLQFIGFLLLLVAAFGRTWSSLFIAGNKNSTVVRSGPYSMVRHPLYFFSLAGFAGAGLAFESLTITAGFIGVFALTHVPTMLAEERKLARKYGSDYVSYAASVPRLVPALSLYHAPALVEADTRTFTRAMVEAALIMLVFPVAWAIEIFREMGLLPVLLVLP